MKKILILLIIPLLLGGCYDYNELEDLAIISGIGIDYQDDLFEVTYEVLSTKKQGDSSSSSNAYTITSSGKTVSEAFASNGNNLDKVPYFDHIEAVIVSEEIANNHLQEVSEYLIRSSKVRNEFYLTIASETSAKDIISTTSKEKPSASTFIVDLLEHSKSSDSAGYYAPFTKTLRNILTEGEDAMLPIFSLEDEKIVLKGLGVFKDYELKEKLNTKEASIMNLLSNFEARTIFFEATCSNGKTTVMSLYEAKTEIEPNSKEIKISGTLNGRINENNCEYDLKDEKSYEELQNIFQKIIESEIESVITKLQNVESNALSIGKNYYNKTRKKDFFLWTTEPIKFDLDFKINKKGLIFEVEQ